MPQPYYIERMSLGAIRFPTAKPRTLREANERRLGAACAPCVEGLHDRLGAVEVNPTTVAEIMAFLQRADTLTAQLRTARDKVQAIRNKMWFASARRDAHDNFISVIDDTLKSSIPVIRAQVVGGNTAKAVNLSNVITAGITASKDVLEDFDQHYASFWLGFIDEAKLLAQRTSTAITDVVKTAVRDTLGVPLWAAGLGALAVLVLINKLVR